MNLQYFEPPLKVQNNDAVSCPYIKQKIKYINTPIPQPQHLVVNQLNIRVHQIYQTDCSYPGLEI